MSVVENVELPGANGSCTTHATPALSVSVGLILHESWMNAFHVS